MKVPIVQITRMNYSQWWTLNISSFYCNTIAGAIKILPNIERYLSSHEIGGNKYIIIAGASTISNNA
jgi:hypothetical protein